MIDVTAVTLAVFCMKFHVFQLFETVTTWPAVNPAIHEWAASHLPLRMNKEHSTSAHSASVDTYADYIQNDWLVQIHLAIIYFTFNAHNTNMLVKYVSF